MRPPERSVTSRAKRASAFALDRRGRILVGHGEPHRLRGDGDRRHQQQHDAREHQTSSGHGNRYGRPAKPMETPHASRGDTSMACSPLVRIPRAGGGTP